MRVLLAVMAIALSAGTAGAEELEVKIAKDRPTVTVPTESGPVEIRRIQDAEHEVTGEWARTSRACPPFCIQPISPAPGVTTIGELELLDMLQDPAAIVLDSRTEDWFEKGSIPGAVNMPYTQAADRLDELGCTLDFDGFICEDVPRVALFCNGAWCGQSPAAIRRMIEAGFPAERLFYYRGGMQAWRGLGLTVTDPAQ